MRERQPPCSVHAASGRLLAFLGGDQPYPTPHLAAHLDAANGRSAQQSHTSDQLANELFRYPTAPQSQASLLRSDTPQLQMDLRVIPILNSAPVPSWPNGQAQRPRWVVAALHASAWRFESARSRWHPGKTDYQLPDFVPPDWTTDKRQGWVSVIVFIGLCGDDPQFRKIMLHT